MLIKLLYFLLAIVIFFYHKNKKIAYSTPACIVTFSIFVGLFFAEVGGLFFDFLEVSNIFYIISFIVCLIFFAPMFFCKKNIGAKREYKKSIFQNNIKLIYIFLFIVLTVHFARCMSFGSVGSELFEYNYSRHLGAHFLNLLIVAIAYTICFMPVRKNIIFIVIGLFFVFLSGTKYHLIFIFATCFIIFMHRKPRFRKIFKIVFFIFFTILSVFIINYFVGFKLRGISTDNFLEFVIVHFLKYVGGATIAFGEIIENDLIKIDFFNSYISSTFTEFIGISSSVDEITNVYTSFGSFLFEYGYLKTLMIFIIGSCLFNFLYFYRLKTSSSLLAYSFFVGTPLLMTFFSSFWVLTNIFEWGFLALIFEPFFLSENSIFQIVFKYRSNLRL